MLHTLSPIASCTNIASLEMWKMILASLASLSKKLISFFSTACKYFKRKRAVCLSPVCIQNATPEKIVVNSDHVMGVVIWVITSLVYPSLSPFVVNVRLASNYSHLISNKNITWKERNEVQVIRCTHPSWYQNNSSKIDQIQSMLQWRRNQHLLHYIFT